jgi:integrase
MLTDAKIKNAKPGKKPAKLTDSHGLYLEVRPSGAKLWRYRYRIAGAENVFALGEYLKSPESESENQADARKAGGHYTLAEARIERDRYKRLVKQGIHPAHYRQAQRVAQVAENANTFEAIAREWIEQRKPKWAAYYLRQVENMLAADAYPYIGALPMRSITAAHLLEIIKRAEKRGAETVAILLRQWCSAIFRYAVATLRADADPAAALKGAIHRPKVEHSKPLARKDIPEFLKALNSYGGYRTTTIAMRLLMLTFVRTVELRGAEWTEFDLDGAEWRIPAERMKMRELHIVPLSAQTVELLRELHTLTGGQRFLFPNYRRPKTCMTATTLNRALERMGYGGKFSGHGFRATASTMLNEMGFRSDLIERQLAHAERNKVRASYNQAEYLPERKEMMQAWANLIDEMAKGENKVKPIKSKTAA